MPLKLVYSRRRGESIATLRRNRA